MSSRKFVGDIKLDILKTIAGFVGTGLLGAAVTYGITEYNRLPSRALTILPAGIHVLEGPSMKCDDTQFIVARVNSYLDTNIKVPPCDVLLTKSQASDVVEGLEAAKKFYQSERLHYFQLAKIKLTEIAKSPPQSDDKLKEATLAAVGDLEYISRHAPREYNGTELLKWAQARVDDVIKEVTDEFNRMDGILTGLKGGAVPHARHTEFYFVATNSSDAEFYISTTCVVRAGDKEARAVVEKLDRDDVLSYALVYMPILPGRGKLMKYAPVDEKEMTDVLAAKNPVKLTCKLANSKTIETKEFDPSPFFAVERTYATE